MARRTARSADRKPASRRSASRVRWEEGGAATHYANSCALQSMEGAVVAHFGIDGRLTRRVVITPTLAKRLLARLAAVVGDYEKSFGRLDLG